MTRSVVLQLTPEYRHPIFFLVHGVNRVSNTEVGSVCLLLLVLLFAVHVAGYLFTRLRQPRVIGEILAGLLLGPTVLGRIAPRLSDAIFSGVADGAGKHGIILNFIYTLGLLLLMFVSGAETRHLFSRHDRRQTAWLAIVGTGLPFALVILLSPWLPLHSFAGANANSTALLLVIWIAVAVTSIPVISRILHDLGILHTRFARLILGVAVLEDIALWAVLAIATALASSAALPKVAIARHLAATLLYFAFGLTLGPALLRRLHRARLNLLATASPVGYVLAVLFAYGALAAALDVNLVFAAFLAGFALTTETDRFADALASIGKFSFAVFIPIYFAVVGYRLDLAHSLSPLLLGGFLLFACVLKLASVALGARFAGFGLLDTVNLAIATNARGGPGIVLASVAYDAHIINATAFTTLVLVAVLTSQAAGAWLEFVLRRGWPLLSEKTIKRTPLEVGVPDKVAA